MVIYISDHIIFCNVSLPCVFSIFVSLLFNISLYKIILIRS